MLVKSDSINDDESPVGYYDDEYDESTTINRWFIP